MGTLAKKLDFPEIAKVGDGDTMGKYWRRDTMFSAVLAQDAIGPKNGLEETSQRKEFCEEMDEVLDSKAVSDVLSARELAFKKYQERKRVALHCRSVEKPFSSFYCPLTREIMKEPVMVSNNKTYEREAIESWFKEGHSVDPLTMKELADTSLRPNRDLQKTILEWQERDFVVQILKAKEKLTRDGAQGKEQEQEQAIDILSRLCEKSTVNKYWVSFEGLIPYIVGCLTLKNYNMKLSALSLLKELVMDNDWNKELLIQAGGLEAVSCFLLKDSHLKQASIELLAELVKDKVACRKLGQQQGTIMLLVACFMNGEDASEKEKARLILEQLSGTDENVRQMVEANWCSPFVNRLSHGPEESKLALVIALAEMQLTDRQREAFVTDDVISPLFRLMQSGKVQIEDATVKALQNLSSSEAAKSKIVELGIFPILLEKMFSEKSSQDFKVAAAGILENLTWKYGGRSLADAFGMFAVNFVELIHNLVEILANLTLRVSSSSLHVHVLKVLLGLASPSDAHVIRHCIKKDDGMIVLLHLLKHRELPEVCILVINLLVLLLDENEDDDQPSHPIEDFMTLIDILNDDFIHLDVRVGSAKILAKLAQGDCNLSVVVETSSPLPALVNMISLPNNEAKDCALGALLRFMDLADARLQQSLAEMGLIPQLVELLKSKSPQVKIKAAVALKHFSLCSSHLSVEPQKRLSKLPWNFLQKCRVHRGRCSVKTTFCLLEAGAVPSLVEALCDPHNDVAEAAVDTLSTLVAIDSVEKGAEVLHDFGAISQLLNLISSCSLTYTGKYLNLLERILQVSKMKAIYGQQAKVPLMSLVGCHISDLSQTAIRMVTDLTK
eukprot:c28940_g1_i1 orf=656-3178(+)